MQRFDTDEELFQGIQEVCRDDYVRHVLPFNYPFLKADGSDIVSLLRISEEMIQKDYPQGSLIISLGESPSKLLFLQSKMKSFSTRELDYFIFPVSKTILHLGNLTSFYDSLQHMSENEVRHFFESYMVDDTFALRYISFLEKRGLLTDFIEKLSKATHIVFVDIVIYGNSFLGFFLYLWLPLVRILAPTQLSVPLSSVFWISPDNQHGRVADLLRLLLESQYFQSYHIIDMKHVFSKEHVSSVAHFFMDHDERVVQQVCAPDYAFPVTLPDTSEYMVDLRFLLGILLATDASYFSLEIPVTCLR